MEEKSRMSHDNPNARRGSRAGGAVRGNSRIRLAAGWLATVVAAAVPAGVAAQEPPPVAATITLDQAIGLSLERDPAAVAADVAVTTAGANQMQARGALLPSLAVNTSYANSSNQRFDQATGQLVSESYAAQLTAGYDLFQGGRRLAELRVAGAELAAADASYRAQRFTTILQTTRAFYEAAAAAEVLGAAEQRLERARQQASFAETRMELGTATLSDMLRAELETGNAELATLEALTALRRSQLELGRRVGIEGAVQPVAASLPTQAPLLPDTDALVARALRASPAVVAAGATLRSRQAARTASMSTYLPNLRVQGGYDWFSFDFPPQTRSWNMRVIASMPLFNNFQREAAVQRATAQERVAQARSLDAVHQARVGVESAAQDVSTAERRVAISGRAVELAREDLRVQEERYQIGATTILELQSSQIALTDAEIASVRARQALGVAVAQLEAVLGERISGND
jgi:outer membrane protein